MISVKRWCNDEVNNHPDPKETSTFPFQRKSWWRSLEAWKRVTSLCFMWITSSATFWSVNLSASDLLPGNRHLNLVILGIMHIPSLLLGLVFGRFCSRKATLSFFFLGGCVCFLASFLSQFVGGLTADHQAVFWLTIVGRLYSSLLCWTVVTAFTF